MASIVTFLMTTNKFVFLDNCFGDFFSCNCRMSLVNQKLLTLPEHMNSPQGLSGVCVAKSLAFCVVLSRSLFVLLPLFCWPLCCLSFVLFLLVTSFVSSHFSYKKITTSYQIYIILKTKHIYFQMLSVIKNKPIPICDKDYSMSLGDLGL